MTQNQIRWFEANEQVKHNRATEAEANRHNLVMEDQGQQDISEKARSNMANEGIKTAQLAEQVRAAHVNEDISWANLSENERKNRVSEQLGFATLDENIRSHIENERVAAQTLVENVRIKYSELEEKVRHDLETEKIDRKKADDQLLKINNDFDVEMRKIEENYRHNVWSELETRRSNLAKEKQALREYEENQRHNFETEKAKDIELQVKSLEAGIKQKEADIKLYQVNLDRAVKEYQFKRENIKDFIDFRAKAFDRTIGILPKLFTALQ